MVFTPIIYYIMSNAVATRKTMSVLYSRSTFVVYFFSILLVYQTLDWYFFEKSSGIYNGLMFFNSNNMIFIIFMFILSFFILILTSFYPTNSTTISVSDSKNSISKANENTSSIFTKEDFMQIRRDYYLILEYPLILQFILIGGISLLSSGDLVTLFLSIELQSYGLYIVCALYRNSESSTSAGLTYFLLGGLASCIILLGSSFLYINSGLTSLDGLYILQNIITSDGSGHSTKIVNKLVEFYTTISTLGYYEYALQFSLVILVVGFLFKIAAAPFHSWSPGVYDAIPTVTTTYVATIPKVAILSFFFDLVYSTWYTTLKYSWTNILVFSSFISLIVGSVAGLTQSRIKRLYAYSTVSHVGFILLALSIHSVESIQAFFFYIIQYSLSNINAFFILILIGYTYTMYQNKTKLYEFLSYSTKTIYNDYIKKINMLSPIEYIDQLKGYFYLNPLLAISLAGTLFSFIGVPPLVGFFAKQMVLSSALDNGNIFMCLIAILTSVVSAVYYLYVVKHMFFEKSNFMINNYLVNIVNEKLNELNTLYNSNDKTVNKITLSAWLSSAISILTLITVLFIFLYTEIYFLLNILCILIIY